MIELVKWRHAGKAYLTEVGTLTVVVSVHPNGGWQWCTNHANGPSGYDPGLASAKTHAVEYTKLWLAERVAVSMGRAPIPWEELDDEHDETAEIVAAAVARERAAVFEYLAELAVNADTVEMERVLLEAAGDIHRGEHRRQEEP